MFSISLLIEQLNYLGAFVWSLYLCTLFKINYFVLILIAKIILEYIKSRIIFKAYSFATVLEKSEMERTYINRINR